MDKRFGAAVLAGLVVAGGAGAQEFRGAEVQAEILAFTEDSDLGETAYRGSLEFGIFGGFGVQADLGFSNSRAIDLGSRTVALHGTYDVQGLGTAGVFFARDSETGETAGDGGVDSYGIEAASNLGLASAEAYLGHYESEGDDSGLIGGVHGRYEIASALSVTGSGAFLGGDLEASRLAIGGEYDFNSGPVIFAEVGRLSLTDEEGEGSETFVTLGARLAIGPNRGTSFGERGLFDVLSGF